MTFVNVGVLAAGADAGMEAERVSQVASVGEKPSSGRGFSRPARWEILRGCFMVGRATSRSMWTIVARRAHRFGGEGTGADSGAVCLLQEGGFPSTPTTAVSLTAPLPCGL